MLNETYLDKLATRILEQYSSEFLNIVVVLPNKRARVFLIAAFQKQIKNNIFAPQITNIEDFVQDIADIRSIDPIEQLFEFYDVYLQLTAPEKQQNFDVFANWAKTCAWFLCWNAILYYL